MAIQKEIWARDLAENIVPDNSSVLRSIDDSDYLEGRTVHLPQSGALPNVEVNRTTLPALTTVRNDTTATYNIEEFTTDPVVLRATEQVELSYDKRMSLLRDHVDALQTRVTGTLLQIWAPNAAGLIVRTTGALRPAYVTGQTGNRKRLTADEFKEVRRLMDRQDIPSQGRLAVISADHYADLIGDTELAKMLNNAPLDLPSGAIGRLYGFDIYVRSSTLVYDNAGTPQKKAVGSVVAATDNAASLFWHPSFVRRAFGSPGNGGVQVFEKQQDPQYYGDIFSAMVRAGGRARYTDNRGVIAIVEAA